MHAINLQGTLLLLLLLLRLLLLKLLCTTYQPARRLIEQLADTKQTGLYCLQIIISNLILLHRTIIIK